MNRRTNDAGLPTIAWTAALGAMAAAWGSMNVDTPWSIILQAFAVVDIATAASVIGIWGTRARSARKHDDGSDGQ